MSIVASLPFHDVLICLIKMILVSAVLYAYYMAVLRNGNFHRYNRWFLLGVAALSLVLPLLRVPAPQVLALPHGLVIPRDQYRERGCRTVR